MKIVVLDINKNIPGHAAGSTARIMTDSNGTPLDKFWRDRLRDADVDNCVSIKKPEKKLKAEGTDK